jgi:hypothetical protein
MDIAQLLRKRGDLSTFVVHFTRKGDDGIAPGRNLKSILTDETIEARTSFGPATSLLQWKRPRELKSQKCVSFSETPLEHLDCLTSEISGRRFSLSPYGLAFTKTTARRMGVNPIWYIDITPGHDWLMKPINQLIDRELKTRKKFGRSPLAQITPFIEQMGSGLGKSGFGYRKEFWWEREWRYRGDFRFTLSAVAIGLVPEHRVKEFGKFTEKLGRRIPFVDPKWSLERMITHLAGCRDAKTCFDD